MKRLAALALAVTATCMSAGCSDSSISSVQAWMGEERNKIHPAIKPLPEPVPYRAIDYVAPAGVEPFSMGRLVQALNAANANSNNSVLYKTIVEGHRKQPLEAYPLDAITYVGMLNKNNRPVALVKVDSLLYQVHVGEFMGQNFGRVLSIDESQIALREVAQDAAGEWVERNASLNLQEGSK